jgi:GNAT superfamily N-acetyltransferase
VSEIRVRRAQRSDTDFLVRGNAAMALETEHLTLDPARLNAGVDSLFDDPSRGFYLIAECDGRSAGQMMITYEWSDWRNGTFWWIQSVYVVPAFRKRGVFTELYRHVERASRTDSSICGLRLYVETGNARAQSTYANVGMKRTNYEVFEVDYRIRRDA